MKIYTKPLGAKVSKKLKKEFDEKCLKVRISKSAVLRYLIDSFAKGNIVIEESEDLLSFDLEYIKGVKDEDKEPFIIKVSANTYEELEHRLVDKAINKTFIFTWLLVKFITGEIRVKNDLWS